jgi:hypothetical protein
MVGISRTRIADHWQFLESQGGGPIAASSIFAVSLVCFLACTLAIQAEPWRQPGETWSSGFLSDDTIRLLDSGEFLRASWCDICAPRYSSGTWRQSGARLVLQGDGGVEVLHRVPFDGCDLLVPEELLGQPDAWLDVAAYQRKGDACSTP